MALNKHPLLSVSTALSLSAICFAPDVLADKVYLKNGDIITGNIIKIWGNKLTVDPSYSDNLKINLTDIAYLEGDKAYTLKFIDGVETEGSLNGQDTNGNQVLALTTGESRTITLDQLTELQEPQAYYDWGHEVSVSGQLDRGNTKSDDLSVRYDSTLKMGDHRHILAVQFDRESRDDVDTKEQDRVNYGYHWTFEDPWFLGINTAYERDPIKDLTYRYSILPGIGYEIWNDSWRFFTIETGVGYRKEKVGGEESDSATAGWNLRFSHDLMGGDLEVFHNHTLYSNINGRDNTVFNSRSGVKFEVIEDLNVRVEVDYDKESNPSGGANESDTTVLFGLGYEF